MAKEACGSVMCVEAGLKFIAAFLMSFVQPLRLEVRSSVLPLVSYL